MKNSFSDGLLPKIFGILMILALSGIALRPHKITRGFELARVAQSENSPDAAQRFAALAEQMPYRADLWQQAGFAALAQHDYLAAIEYFSQAKSLSPAGMLALGDAHQQNGDLEAAISIWEQFNNQFGSSEESLTRLASTYLLHDNYDAAIAALKELSTFNLQPSTLYQLGLLLAAHNPAAAPPYLHQAAELDSEIETSARALAFTIQRALQRDESAYTLLVAGQELAHQNHWELAYHAFARATELRPDYAEAWAYLGEAAQQLEAESPSGLAALEKALALDAQSFAANTFMALYWQRQGDSETSQAYIQTAAALDPQNIPIQIYLAELLAQAGDLATAHTFYQQIIADNPDKPLPYQALTEFCIRYNFKLNEIGLPAARQAVLLAPRAAAALDVMGQILLRLGDQLNAERFFLRALHADADYAPVHLHLGWLYILQDESVLARGHLKAAIELAPNTQAADHAQRLLGDYLGGP